MVLVIATRFPHKSVTALPFRFYGKLFLHFIAVGYWGLGGNGEMTLRGTLSIEILKQ